MVDCIHLFCITYYFSYCVYARIPFQMSAIHQLISLPMLILKQMTDHQLISLPMLILKQIYSLSSYTDHHFAQAIQFHIHTCQHLKISLG